ncbi:BA75_03043T0 [Komagataella pastoris]|uniref:BA75_03043T0 n=1 Tax=Komagataella pastoris TaxID=4922 RepID=A0A1B2JC77_PICPA|nr:BA75_03043T0 [Komagataella pastoris]
MVTKVPSLVKKVFDTFPVIVYSSDDVVSQLDFDESYFELRRFSFQSTGVNAVAKFQLGVYSLSPCIYDSSILIPVDPLCLSTCLIMCVKNGLKLPQIGGEHGKDTSMVVMAYQASPDSELPLLVEDDLNGQKRVARSYQTVKEFQDSRANNVKETMLIELIDGVLFDAWLIMVIFELPKELTVQLYGLVDKEDPVIPSHDTGISWLDSLRYSRIVNSSIRRNGFQLRHPNIAQYFESFTDKYSGLSSKMEFEKKGIIDRACHVISQFEGILSEAKDVSLGPVVDYKLASFTYCILHLGRGDLSQAVKVSNSLKFHCQRVINECI